MNLVTNIVAALEEHDFAAFADVPLKPRGRYDIVAVDQKTKSQVILVECKTTKPKYQEELIRDFRRLERFKRSRLLYAEIANTLTVCVACAIWSETPSVLDALSRSMTVPDDELGKIVARCHAKDRLNVSREHGLHVVYFGRQL